MAAVVAILVGFEVATAATLGVGGDLPTITLADQHDAQAVSDPTCASSC
jgi:hypothetical protein